MSTESEDIKRKYTRKYKVEYCDQLIKYLEQGKSYITFGGKIGVVTSTLYEWEKSFPEWKTAKDIGMQKAQEFFEDKLLAKLEDSTSGKDIDTSCLIFALKTRFHSCYGDKKETEHTGEIKISIDDDESKL